MSKPLTTQYFEAVEDLANEKKKPHPSEAVMVAAQMVIDNVGEKLKAQPFKPQSFD